MREKLADLIAGTKYGKDLSTTVGANFQRSFIERIADYLIDNGVTVQRWRRATEELPSEYERWVRGDDGAIEPREFNVIIGNAELATTLYFNGESFCDDDGNCYPVTHWMPLPAAPKEGAE